MLRSAAVTALSIGLGGGLAYLAVGPAWPHDAIPTAAKPLGWSYPVSCCSGYDCREVSLGGAGSVILERPEGYVVAETGEVVPYTDTRVKESPDGRPHWCSVAGKADGRTICLFVPPRGF